MPSVSRVLSHFVIVSALMLVGCTTAQKDQFSKAMTGAPTTQPGGVVVVTGGVEGATQTAATLAAQMALAGAGTPIGGYAAIASSIFGGLLLLERLLVTAGVNLPNSNRSQLASNSASAGGIGSSTGQPSNSGTLKAA